MICFILSIGRSGTKFLANLLNQSEDILVLHEPFEEDYIALPKAYHDQEFAYHYIKNFRLNKIKKMINNTKVEKYCETGNQMRYFIDPLKEMIPDIIFIHLIRDGRDVVRSYMARGIYDRKNRIKRFFEPIKNTIQRGVLSLIIKETWKYLINFILRKIYRIRIKYTNDIYPINDDIYRKLWGKMSRFEKVCWYWKNEHAYLTKKLGLGVQFEKIISDYKYFNNKILKLLDLKISRTLWEKFSDKKVNKTIEHKFPHWKHWDKTKTEIFWKICRKIMEINGYNK